MSDPFFWAYQEALRQGKDSEDALAEVRQLADAPENQAMFSDLSASDTGRILLIEWRREWKRAGLRAPWAGIAARLRCRLRP